MTTADDDERDEFTSSARDIMAGRAGYICSFPGCDRLTVGPSDDRKSRLSMVGVAAHITAAAKRGPRFDATLSPEERSSEHNGIWLCQLHGKLVDDNASIHTVVELRRWKAQHEDWVFRRVANADSHLQGGLVRIALQQLGVFHARAETKLGHLNVVYGLNMAGKSTLCQALAALSGGPNFGRFAARFDFCSGGAGRPIIEAGVAVEGELTTVRLSQEALAVRSKAAKPPQRLHIEVNGNVAAMWPRSLFPIVVLDDALTHTKNGEDAFREALKNIAGQLGIADHVVWDALREETFISALFGYRFKRTGPRKVEILVPSGRTFYLPPGNLGGGEFTFALVDIVLKLLRSDPRRTPWTLVLDTGFFTRLDSTAKQTLVDRLANQAEPRIQIIVCVNFATDAELLKVSHSDRWIGATRFGDLTIHAFV